MTIVIDVTHRGERHVLHADQGVTLMTLLRDADLGVDGMCGGFCACGTCHVYVSPDWQMRLPPIGDAERDMLAALADQTDVRPTSRLACQIDLAPGLNGLAITVGAGTP